MKNNIILTIKGFFIGIANIIPGVSGGTLMITLGVYEDIIGAVSHFFKDIKKHLKLIFWIGIGAVVSIIVMSKVIVASLENFRLPTILFFCGLILGGIPMLYGKVKGKTKDIGNILVFLLMFALVISMLFIGSNGTEVNLTDMNFIKYILLFIVGIVAAATMVIPGISGSFVLMFLGYYEPVLNRINELTKFKNIFQNLIVLGTFGIGLVIGIILVAKLIEFLLKKYETKTFSGILGFVMASVVSIIVGAIRDGVVLSIGQISCAVVLFIIGFAVAYKLGD